MITSELAIMENLVMPYRVGDTALVDQFENLFLKRGIDLTSVSPEILRAATRLRATIPAIRTPDAMHAVTALLIGCSMFLTNDTGFRRVSGFL